MKRQDSSKEVEQAQKVTPVQVLMGRVFYRSSQSDEKGRDVNEFSPSEFDALALRFVDEIDNVKRDVWDVFARCKFLNWLVDEGDVTLVQAEGKFMFTEVPAEEKSSVQADDNTASQAV